MANAKLWWNGSDWATSNASAVYTQKTGNYQLGIAQTIIIVAYDDMTLKMSQSASVYQTGSIYNNRYLNYFNVTVKSGDVTIGYGIFSNADVTPYTSFTYSGSGSATGNASGTNYNSGTLSFSGSINITSPFRTITFNVNGGTGDVGTQTVLTGITASVMPVVVPTRENYAFVGWNTASDGTGTAYANGANIGITEDTTLYAQWEQTAFAVSISADEGATITLDGQSFTNQTATIYKPANTYALTIVANAGFVIKTRTPASDGNVVVSDNTTVLSATSQHVGCRIDDGNNWVQALIYYDDGAQWVMCQAYYDDGAQWNLLN